MPVMNGADFLREVKERSPDTIRIMLTGHANTDAVMGAINEGAVYKFILKPWNDDDLRVTVALALEQYDLIQKNKCLEREVKDQTNELKALKALSRSSRSRLGALLHRRGHLTDRQLQELHTLQKQRKTAILKILQEKGWIPETAIYEVLKKEKLVEEVALPEFQVDPHVTELIPHQLCERQLVLPLKLTGKHRLLLAVADPTDQELIEDLRFITGLEIQPLLAPMADITGKITAIYGEKRSTESFKDMITVMSGGLDPIGGGIEVVIEEEDDITLDELLRSTDEPPAIRLLNAVIIEAVRHNASDIHIQPRLKGVVVRYRIDGVLVEKIHFPVDYHLPLVSRLKVMADLDITDRRRPQDGRITVKTPMKILDMRISIIPTINGEKVVMRLLDRNAPILRLSELGLSRSNLDRMLHLISRPEGIILATGPTGSGKTTTLYSLLQHNVTTERNYITIEDPVEYFMDSAAQVSVREKIGVDFAQVLRSILRQDPDVIFVGEIRDLETAEVAFHAALTGHQVFSTLHTNSALESFGRLVDLGLKPYIVATALSGVISQRLVRRICESCREEVKPDGRVLQRLGLAEKAGEMRFYQGQGCSECHQTGLNGRIAIQEIFIPDENTRAIMSSGQSIVEIKRAARETNRATLLDDAVEKVQAGLITIDEVLRVFGSQVLQ
jgi:type II secretory ATPase GspE/PulE/Tfp pilus assembly ATPase PilB-like protein